MSIKRNLGGALNSLNRQVALVLFVPSCAKHPLYLLHLFRHSQPLAIARLATSSLRSSVARPTLSPSRPALKPSYSQVVKPRQVTCDPEKVSHVSSRVPSHDLPAPKRSRDKACDFTPSWS